MKTKNIMILCRLLCCCCVAGLLTACTDFLEESPNDRVDDENAIRTVSDLYLNAVAARYADVGGNANSQGLQGTGRGVYDLNTFTTDEAIIPTRGTDWYDGHLWQDLFQHKFAGLDPIGDTWNYLMKAIMGCNGSLEQIDKFAQKHPEANLDAYRAEVRGLRAMFYFYAIDLYGRVPLFTSSSPSAADLKLKNRSEAIKHVVGELQQVVPQLAEERSNQAGTYYGRFTRPVAYFLLAKVFLNSEVYCDDDWTDGSRPDGKAIKWTVDGATMNAWEACVHYCNLITEMGYSLEDVYETNFLVHNEVSGENIFTIPMDKYLYRNQYCYLFRSRHYNHAAALGLNGENGPCATLDALRVFGLAEGDIDGSDPEVDPRFVKTYYSGQVYDLNNNKVLLDDGTPLVYEPWAVALDVSNTPYEKTAGARMKKYEVDPNGTKDGNQSDNDIVLFRYADVLLMQCEAMLRNGQAGAEADMLLELVRGRVGAMTRSATLENVLDERMLELAWEGWRRNDMIRFNIYGSAYKMHSPSEADVRGYTTVFPIPGEILSLSGSAQNPGY